MKFANLALASKEKCLFPGVRIATVYTRKPLDRLRYCTMDVIRWFKMSEALSNKGYSVDIIANGIRTKRIAPNLRYLSYSKVNWGDYDLIKTLFHEGFESLAETGGSNHPFIVSKLGSVVAKRERQGVHAHGELRKRLYETQKEMVLRSRYVSILTQASKNLWNEEFPRINNILIVPTGTDKRITPPRINPYKNFKEKIAIYIGNIYSKTHQRDINLKWQHRFNCIGKLLKKRGVRLCLIVSGAVDKLDRNYVTYMGPVENKDIWDYQHFADAGLVLAQGRQQHNESSKIYYYLRTGLPVVSETPIPNNDIIKGAGFIADYGNNEMIAYLIEKAIYKKWDKERIINYMLENHTWDRRAEVYDRLISRELVDMR